MSEDEKSLAFFWFKEGYRRGANQFTMAFNKNLNFDESLDLTIDILKELNKEGIIIKSFEQHIKMHEEYPELKSKDIWWED